MTMWIFDLDNTLYPPEAGLLDAVDLNIARYLSRRLGVGLEEAQAVRRRLWQTWGTTARGLREEMGWAVEDYFESIYIEDLDHFIGENPGLREMLDAVPVTKAIFTNGHESHARRVLDKLGIASCFKHLVALPPDLVGKPDPAAFARLSGIIGSPLEGQVMFDDEPRILVAARKHGMITVQVGPAGEGDADYAIRSIDDLGRIASKLSA